MSVNLWDEFEFVFGSDCEGIYRNGKLIVAAKRLTAIEVIEAIGIGCDLWDLDDTVYNSPEKLPTDSSKIIDKRTSKFKK